MYSKRRPHRLPTFLLGCLTAALLTNQVVAATSLTINYTDGQTDATPYDTTLQDLTLSILSGTATQSGILTGSGSVIKVGDGTLILSSANDYSGTTTLTAGTLQVVAGGSISHILSNLIVGDQSGDAATLLLSGGSISNDYGTVGNSSGSSGTVIMSGGSWANDANLYVGYEGTGMLKLSGGTISSDYAYLGVRTGSSGTANVSGGKWTSNTELTVGYLGTGVLNFSGGTISAETFHAGYVAGGSGTMNVSGGALTSNTSYFLGESGSGVLNLSGGSIHINSTSVATNSGSSGTANVSGGTWTNDGSLVFGENGTGMLNLSGGSVSAQVVYQGLNVGSIGTMNVSGGTLTNNTSYFLGKAGTGVLNLSGGSIHNNSTSVGFDVGGSGTANVSGGIWTNDGSLVLGENGTGLMNLSGGTVTAQIVYLGLNAGSTGTLNIGTGGAAGNLETQTIIGGDGTAVLNFNHTGSLNFTPTLDGNLLVNQIGPGTTTLTAANTYTGTTAVLGGTLELSFGNTSSDILPSSSDLSMGSGTLLLTGQGDQTLNSLNTVGGAGSIVLGQNQFLDLGTLDTVADYSALNFNTAAGGADGDTLGNSAIRLPGATAGSVFNSVFTVTDSTGFGLATVNDKDLVVRLTTTDLLPASSADSGSDYRIDNNGGTTTTAGSSTLIVTDSQSVRSITVDTTAASGVLTLADNAVINTNVWNFGSAAGSSHAFEITGGANSGITTDVSGGFIQINNYNAAPVTISTSILETDATGLQVGGTGTTILTATSSYTGNTVVTGGVLEVATNGSINNDPASTIVGSQAGDNGSLHISGGSITDGVAILGDSYGASGTATVSAGTWTTNKVLAIGNDGTGVLNISGGIVQDSFVYAGAHSTGRGTVNVSGGQWSVDKDLLIGGDGTAALNLSSGSVVSGSGTLGNQATASGTANVSGGTWASSGDLTVGNAGTGVLNISGGSVSNTNAVLGQLAGSSGTASVSGGSWQTSSGLFIGNNGMGVLSISGGSVTSSSAIAGSSTGSSGTVNVSGGTWQTSSSLSVGLNGTGVLNLTDGGTVTVGSLGFGTVSLATSVGSSGTLNFGTGGAAGTLYAASIVGGDGTAVVNFNQSDKNSFNTALGGSMTVNQIGSGITTLSMQNTYTGATNVLGGRLVLSFGKVPSNILPTTTDLTLGSATLLIAGAGSQNVSSLSTVANSAGSIILGGRGQSLDLGALASVGAHSALNFITTGGGANGSIVGSSSIQLHGQTPGSAINPGFTVTDTAGFGLATVNGLNQVIRLTSSDLLPATLADSSTDYLIDNNSGGSAAAGSSSLLVTDPQTARSITVDTTATAGLLSLASGAVLSSDVWNFGSAAGSSHAFEITGSVSGAGITTATAGGTLQFNNFNASPVTLSTNILDNAGSSALFQGSGTTILSGSNSYSGDTTVSSGVLQVASTGSINGSGTTTIGSQTGDDAHLDILGTLSDSTAVLGDAAASAGSATVGEKSTWNNTRDLTIGKSGTGMLTILDGGHLTSDNGYIGLNAGSSGIVTLNGFNAEWNLDTNLTVGSSGTGVLNIDEGYVQSSSGYIGLNPGSTGTVTVSNGAEWDVYGTLAIGQDGIGVLNLTSGGGVVVFGDKKTGGLITLGAQGTLNIGTGGAAGFFGQSWPWHHGDGRQRCRDQLQLLRPRKTLQIAIQHGADRRPRSEQARQWLSLFQQPKHLHRRDHGERRQA